MNGNQFTNQAAKEIVERANMGFDPGTILLIMNLIKSMFDMFQQCKNPDPDPPTPQSYVQARYRKGRYNPPLLNHVIRELKRQAHRSGEKLTEQQARDLAVSTLDQIKDASSEKVGNMCIECS